MFSNASNGALCWKRFRRVRIDFTRRSLKFNYLTVNAMKRSGTKLKPKLQNLWIKSGIITITIGGSVYLVDKYAYASTISRSVRALSVLLWIAYEYSMNISKYGTLEDLHEVASETLFNMLMENRGLYIKLGQAIANQGDFFPKAYQKRFVRLYDDAPVDKWKHVDKVLRKNLGENYETEVFEIIDHEPIASASIAQVHKAILKDTGDTVAVKIQHDYIHKQIAVDLFMYKLISKIYERVFNIPLTFFTEYVSEQLQHETDFVQEMKNSNRLLEIIKKDKSMRDLNIYIPFNYPKFTKRQILITEWCDGIPLSDKNKVIESKVDLSRMVYQYLKVFGKQIFEYGFVHSDPHPGNLLARFDKSGKQQLVILDHGLYIQLPENFRLEYCKLWENLFSFNTEAIESIGRSWGINSTELFATIIQLRPIKMSPKSSTRSDQDINNLLQDFLSDTGKFPLELLFLTRTMRMLQSLNRNFGSPVNRINILTHELVSALVVENLSTMHTRTERVMQYLKLFKVRCVLIVSNLVFYLIRFKQILSGDKYGEKKGGIEDYLEVYIQNTVESLGLDWT